jgi:hypothetical protein
MRRDTDYGYHDEYDEETDNYTYHNYQYYNTEDVGEAYFRKEI